MNKIKNKLMYSCKEAAALIDKKMAMGLGIREHFGLAMHKMACSACRMYEKQSNLLDKKLHESLNREPNKESNIDSNDLESRIISELKKKV